MGKYVDAHERYETEREWLSKPFREMNRAEKRSYIVICAAAVAVMLLCAFAPVG